MALCAGTALCPRLLYDARFQTSPAVASRKGQVLFLVEIIEAGQFNQQQARLASPYRVSSPSEVRV